MVNRRGTLLLGAGLSALALAGAALWWRHSLRQDWLNRMRASDCSPVIDLPDVALQTWGAAACALLAVLLCTAYAVGGRGRERGAVLAGTLLAAVAGVVLLSALFLATTTPTDAADGLDGSGLPCEGSF